MVSEGGSSKGVTPQQSFTLSKNVNVLKSQDRMWSLVGVRCWPCDRERREARI